MARGPKGERRPDDPAAAAVESIRIAVGEIPEVIDESATALHVAGSKPKNPAARLSSAKERLRRIERLLGPYSEKPETLPLPPRREWKPREDITMDKVPDGPRKSNISN